VVKKESKRRGIAPKKKFLGATIVLQKDVVLEIKTPSGVWRSRSATAACEGSARGAKVKAVRGARVARPQPSRRSG